MSYERFRQADSDIELIHPAPVWGQVRAIRAEIEGRVRSVRASCRAIRRGYKPDIAAIVA